MEPGTGRVRGRRVSKKGRPRPGMHGADDIGRCVSGEERWRPAQAGPGSQAAVLRERAAPEAESRGRENRSARGVEACGCCDIESIHERPPFVSDPVCKRSACAQETSSIRPNVGVSPGNPMLSRTARGAEETAEFR